LTGEILDAHRGLEDLADRTLRAVDRVTFPDDPLRVWRAFQFAARLDFRIEAETFALLTAMVRRGDLAQLSRERVTDEIRKLLAAQRPSTGLKLARDTGALASEFPELHALAATPQDPEWHPEGDVWVHTLMVVDAAAEVVARGPWNLREQEPLHVMLGALLHDLGKASTTARVIKDGRPRIVSPRHEAEGVAFAGAVLSRLTFGEEAERAVLAIVRWHLSPGALFYALLRGELDPRSYANAVRKVLKRIHPVRWQVLVAACEGDWRGRGIEGVASMPFDPGVRFAEAIAAEQLDSAPAQPLVLGRDVLALGVSPGPEVGRLIDEVEAARDRGEITAREEALQLLSELVNRK
jgi:tRNA nucleotidyltransferase (CCA-adding enzyme)